MDTKVAVKSLQWLPSKDPTFNAGESRTAKATLTNQTDQALTCTTELYLDVTKVASSGVSSSFTIPAGGSIDVTYVVPMPSSSGGPYHVYIDVLSGGALLAHYQATEDVKIVGPLSLYLYPVAAGDALSGTYLVGQYPTSGAHWDKVDDPVGSPDDDLTYVYVTGFSNTLYLSALFKLTAPTGSGTINYIRLHYRFKCANPYTGSSNSICSAEIKTGGALYDYALGGSGGTLVGNAYSGNATGYVEGYVEWKTNPKTGLPWTWTDLASLQAGVRMYGAFSATESRCTQCYVEVNYTPG